MKEQGSAYNVLDEDVPDERDGDLEQDEPDDDPLQLGRVRVLLQKEHQAQSERRRKWEQPWL